MFDEAQLRSFAILAHLKHYGQAASQLFITQPALTRRIQMLEADIGVPLFRRAGRGVELTTAGAALLPEAEQTLAQMENARVAARRAAGTLAGKLSVGFDGAASYALIPRLVRLTRAAWPQVDIDFLEFSSLDQMREVHFHRLDVGLVRPLAHDFDLWLECVHREPLALAVPLGHRLAGRRRIEMTEISGEPFVTYSERGSYLRDLIGAELVAARVEPRVVQRMSRTHSILSLVSTGLGLAIVPAGSAAAAFDNIVFKPLPTTAQAEWHAVRHLRPNSDLAASMIKLLQQP